MPSLNFKKYYLLITFLLVLTGSIIALSYLPRQNEFSEIIAFYTLAFLSYVGILKFCKNDISLKKWLLIAVGLRVTLLFSFPNLSDDIYRFIWDGNIIHEFQNPYSLLPTEVKNVAGNDETLLGLLNSPSYYTVYPPFSQFVYWLASFGDISYTWSAFIIKLCLLLAEIGSLIFLIRILKLLKLDASRFLIYALNPLMLIEIMGNVHFEGIMLFFLLSSVYYIIKKQNVVGGFLLAMGTATKLLPLMFFPLLWKFAKYNKKLFASLAISGIILFLPILFGIELTNFFTSIDLYFGKFEFNGGIYYFVRYVGDLIFGYNLIRYIGPLFGLITLGIIFRLWNRQASNDPQQLLLYSFASITSYYLLSTTVHPWYLCLPLALSLFTSYRFVILWTGLIMLSYLHYSFDPFYENLWIPFIEYGLVFGYLCYEWKTKKVIPN